jgi:hypothetical protein
VTGKGADRLFADDLGRTEAVHLASDMDFVRRGL